MEFELSKEQLTLKSEFNQFVKNEVYPYASQFDKDEKISEDLIRKMAGNGYLGAVLPEKYNGRDMDAIIIGILNEEIGAACSSTRSLLTVHGMVELAILKWGSEEQREYWLPKLASGELIGAFSLTEPDVGSDAKNIQTTAVLTEDNYLLNGVKKWTTFGQIADVFLVFAQYEGKPTAFLVDRQSSGIDIKPIKGLLGIRASMSAEIHFENCIVPKENLLGMPGTGLSHVALHSLDYGRYTIACGSVGIGRACLEESIKYSRKRKQFGSSLRQFQLIQKMISEMAVNVKAARLLCYNAGYLKSIGDPDSIMETWNAKYFASCMLGKITGDAVQIHGANGCSTEYNVERYFRDAKIMEIIEGTTQMHELLIATNTYRHCE